MATLPLVVTCEHASAEVPPGVDLGVPEEVLRSHRGWDPGAARLAEALADATGAPRLLGRWTRLLVDLNRSEENPGLVPASSHGAPVPGNAALTPAAREARLEAFYRPYRREAAALVQAAIDARGRCLHLSAHSFTPELDGRRRTVEVGVLFDPDRAPEAAAAEALLAALRAGGWDARPNEPYLGVEDGLTTHLRTRHPAGAYAGIEVELTQAWAASPERIEALTRDIVGALPVALAAFAARAGGDLSS